MRKSIVLALFILVVLAVALIYLPVSPLQRYPGNPDISTTAEGLSVEVVADNLSVPWSLDFIGDDLIFSERSGAIRLIKGGRLLPEPLLTLPSASGEGGTLGLAVDPNFETSRYVFIYYTHEQGNNRIGRFRLVDDALLEEEILLDKIPASPIHNGGRIKFGPDGKLYAGTGDAAEESLAQDPSSLAGKILRINPDGSIPIDNPNGNSYIYSQGHRNVQGLAWDADNERMYATEHGSQAEDELNHIRAGGNYGWPIVRGPAHGTYIEPLLTSGSTTWAPSGMTYYDGDLLPEHWSNTVIFAGLRGEALYRYDPASDNLESFFTGGYGRLRDVVTGFDGALYLLTSNRDGRGDPTETDDRILKITSE